MHCRYMFGVCALGVPVMVYAHVRGGGGGLCMKCTCGGYRVQGVYALGCMNV